MPAEPLKERDRRILAAVRDACAVEGLEPSLIGAAALAIGLRSHCDSRLPRVTLDWDFAVDVTEWERFESLADRLVRASGLLRDAAPHRFRTTDGAVVDLVPYGPIDSPGGATPRLLVDGFEALAKDRANVEIAPGLSLQVAGLHVLVGLKLLAYEDRRPGIRRDVADVDHVLRVIPWDVRTPALPAVAEAELRAGRVHFGTLGAFVVALQVRELFAPVCIERMTRVAHEVATPWSAANRDAARNEVGIADDAVVAAAAERFDAFARGLGCQP